MVQAGVVDVIDMARATTTENISGKVHMDPAAAVRTIDSVQAATSEKLQSICSYRIGRE